MTYRHEWKHEINLSDMVTLRSRLRAVALTDSHAINGIYEIRSLYFDDLSDKALREKLDGVNHREKFRLRYYNKDTSLIHLEKKSKHNGLGTKENATVTKEEAQAIIDGDYEWMAKSQYPLIKELYAKITTQQLRPKTIVDYTREPYIFPAGNVRITMDYHIRTGLKCTDFLNPDCVTIPASNAPIILEVKWDAYLPDIIRDIIQLEGRHSCAFSKYATCRVYG
ncbi:MAG: polyphosphate polymerase domain-containing protein [Eubacterium sp.]|nr:polyphosphate polymerase domain-containing protein [Eubacterium sp.]